MSVKFPFLGGVLGGGGECRFYFYGRADFSDRRGSKKGLSRRHLEGRSTPFREYDPLGVCPIGAKPSAQTSSVQSFSGTLRVSGKDPLGCSSMC